MREGISRASVIGSLAAAALLFAGSPWAYADCDEFSRVALPGCVNITSGGEGYKHIELTNQCLQEIKVKADHRLLGDWDTVLRYGDPDSHHGTSKIRSVQCCDDYSGYRGNSGCDQDYSSDGLQYCLQQFEISRAGQTCEDASGWVYGEQSKCVIQAWCEHWDDRGNRGNRKTSINAYWDEVKDLLNCYGELSLHQC